MELGLSLSRVDQLHPDYLRAGAHGHAETWSSGRSGGAHHPAWAAEVTARLTKLLASQPPSSYSAAASEPPVASTSKPTVPASAAGPAHPNSLLTPATNNPSNPSNAGQFATLVRSGNTRPARTPGCLTAPTNKSC